MRALYAVLLVFTFILAGCVSEESAGAGKKSLAEASFSLEDIKEEHIPYVETYVPPNKEEQVEIPIEEISNFTLNESAPLRVIFFNLGESGSRLILLSKEDYDVAITSVTKSSVKEATSLLQSYADDIELFIIPYAVTAQESAEVAKNLLVAEVVVPDYDDPRIDSVVSSFKKASRVSRGDVREAQGLSIDFETPFKGEITDENNNALSFYVKDHRGFKAFFSNDIIEGAISRLVAEGMEGVDVMTVPNYGRQFGSGASAAVSAFFDMLSPSEVILEGSSVDLENAANLGDERAFAISFFKTKGVDIFPVGNYDRIRLLFDGSSYNITGVVE